ncbi:MAG: hypothetical protein ABJD24_11630 [Acidimicrobiales bacterium]
MTAERLIDKDSTFTRHHVTQAIGAVQTGGASAADIDRLTASVLARPAMWPSTTRPRPIDNRMEQRYTTCRLIALETATRSRRLSRPAPGHSRQSR